MKGSCSLYSKGTRFATEFPCPRGYYNPDPMTQSLDSCLPCPPGHYCGKENLTAASGECDAGESGSVWLLFCAALGQYVWEADAYILQLLPQPFQTVCLIHLPNCMHVIGLKTPWASTCLPSAGSDGYRLHVAASS